MDAVGKDTVPFDKFDLLPPTTLLLLTPLYVLVFLSFLGMLHLSILDKRIWDVDKITLLQARRAMVYAVLVSSSAALIGFVDSTSAVSVRITANAFLCLFFYQIYESNFSTSSKLLALNRYIFPPLIVALAIISLIFLNTMQYHETRGVLVHGVIFYFISASAFLGLKHWYSNDKVMRSFSVVWIVVGFVFLFYVITKPADLPIHLIALYYMIIIIILLVGFLFSAVSSLSLQLIDKVTRLSDTDFLTGLSNRRYFFQQINPMLKLSDRTQVESSLAIIDIDDFKRLNDTYGHEIGDKVLKAFADQMSQTLRGDTLKVRWGGEEFVAFFPMTGIDDASKACLRLSKAFKNSHTETEHVPVNVTVSIGLTPLRSHEELERALAKADEALYQAKTSGKDQLCLSI